MSLIAVGLQLAASTGLAGKLGKWIGGSNGEAVAKQVVSIAQQVTGVDDPAKAAEAVLASKAKLLEFEERLFEREITLSRLGNEDRQGARNMQIVALNQTDVFAKRFIYYFAAAWSAFAFVYLFGITFFEVPKDNVRFADTVLGFLLGTVIAGIICFFYGRSVEPDRPAEPPRYGRVNDGEEDYYHQYRPR